MWKERKVLDDVRDIVESEGSESFSQQWHEVTLEKRIFDIKNEDIIFKSLDEVINELRSCIK